VLAHWEGDLVEGSRGTYVATLVERRSRLVVLIKLSEKQLRLLWMLSSRGAQAPHSLRKSLTWIVGSRLPTTPRSLLPPDMQVYFCDHYRSWQRGSNENTNGLLRRYYPKGRIFQR
jgi:IS30 family transposase